MAGGGKVTPRQKMINMMYLVLTAMLALNVSAEVLDAFVKIETGLDETIKISRGKNAQALTDLEDVMNQDGMKDKVAPWYEKSARIHTATDSMASWIQQLKVELVKATDGEEAGAVTGDDIRADTIQGLDNKDAINRILLGESRNGKAYELKTKVEAYRDYLISEIPDSIKEKANLINEINLLINFTVRKKGLTDTRNWEQFTFENTPLISGLAFLSKIQLDVLNAETATLSVLKNQIGKTDFKISKIFAAVNNPNGVILKGGTSKAEVYLVAFDESMAAKVNFGGRTVNSVNGKTEIMLSGGSVGPQTASGTVTFKGPDGEMNERFEIKYQVVEPSLAVSPTKMNVFYLGVDNPVDISVSGVTPDKIRIATTNGTLTGTGSSRVFRPTAAGKATISVTADVDGKIQDMGTREFRVKRVPDPIPMAAQITGRSTTKGALGASLGMLAAMPPDFDFDLKFTVKSFTVSVVEGGFLKEEISNGPAFTAKQKALIQGIKGNSTVMITDIKASGPDGERQLLDVVYKVR